MKIDFSRQVVLVTGATRGIGKQIAEDFAELGASLVLTGTKQDEIDRLNDSVMGKGKANAQYYCVDFRHRGEINGFLSALGKYERIDVCVNNAGINRINNIDETMVQDWDDIISVNLSAPFLVTREVSRLMKTNGYGRIVNISSIFGVISKEKRGAYSASKFGLHGLTVACSNELARYNVLVNSVSPGFVLTDLTRTILSEKEMAELAAQVPAGRLATADEISKVVLFLASRVNTYITGQNIVADGGYGNV